MPKPTDTLGRFALFRSLDPDAVRRLDAACAWRRVRAKEQVLDRGAGGTDLYFVVRGHVRVVIAAASREVILRDIRDGEFFGELAAIDGGERSAGIVAVTDTTVACMSAAVFRAAVHTFPDVCDQVLAVLAGQIRMLANRANEQSSLGARLRLYAELLRLARPAADGGVVVTPPPTHAELAARVSSHREAVTRELGAMERAGLIVRRRGAIALPDPGRLRALVAQSAES
jgi:CRP/FNR family cyclic AMP-dependent transcriptional regulator